MKPPKKLLQRVIKKTITATELFAEVLSFAPRSAKHDPRHAWWEVEAGELFDILVKASSGTVFLTAADAVAEARRTRGRVVTERISGIFLYRVLPIEEAEIVVTDNLVSEAFPADMVEPTWDDTLPSLDTFRRLAERQYLHRLLDKSNFNITTAAIEAGIARQSLYALLRRHGITRPGSTEQEHQDPQEKVA